MVQTGVCGECLTIYEKYTALAHDANAAGERISAEALAQFADHYYRIHQTILQAADQHRRNQEERQQQNRKPESAASETSEKSADGVKAAELQVVEAVESGAQAAAEADEAVA